MKRSGFKNRGQGLVRSKWQSTKRGFDRFSSLKAKGTSSFWLARSNECRDRDGRRCRRCGEENYRGSLGAAHIIGLGSRGRRDDPLCPLNEMRNLITLCHSCHGGHDQRSEWDWADIGVVPDPALVRKYGYIERKEATR